MLQLILKDAYGVPREVTALIERYKAEIEAKRWRARLWNVGHIIYPALQTKIYNADLCDQTYGEGRLFPDYITDNLIDEAAFINDMVYIDDMQEWIDFNDRLPERRNGHMYYAAETFIGIMRAEATRWRYLERPWTVKIGRRRINNK